MTDSLPSEMVVTELPDGVRYSLPRRKAGRFTFQAGVYLLGSLLMGIPFMCFWLWAVGYHIDWQDILRAENGLLLMFMAFGLWMLVMAVRLGGRGLFQWAGHSEIELRGGVLAGIERLGWLRWSWRRSIAGLSRLDVRDAMMEQGSIRVYESVAAAVEHNAIVPIWGSDSVPEAKRKQLAPGYPHDWLLPLASDLARRCELGTEDHAGIPRPAPPIVVSAEPLPNSAGFVEMLEQPPRSKIAVLQTPEKLTVTVPPRWFGWGGAVFIVSGNELEIVRTKLFGAERRQWSRWQLADIRVGCIKDSEGPDTPELHIQPHPGEGTRFRLALVDEAEARWLATLLRRAVGLPDDGSPEQAVCFRERCEQPEGSRIVCQELPDGVTLTVPPAGSDVKDRILCSLIACSGAALFAALVHFVFEDTGIYYVFSGLGGLFGIAFLVDAGNRARRQVVLSVAGDKLAVRQSSLYGVRREQWPRLRIADVRVGDGLDGRVISPHIRQFARDKANPTYELQIHLRNGEIVRFLDGYGDAELQWLATVLRRALGVPEQSAAS
jgi:hypothetical protein